MISLDWTKLQGTERQGLLDMLEINKEPETVIYRLLDPSYSLQFPGNFSDNNLILDPEKAEDYWLDSDKIVESLTKITNDVMALDDPEVTQAYHDKELTLLNK